MKRILFPLVFVLVVAIGFSGCATTGGPSSGGSAGAAKSSQSGPMILGIQVVDDPGGQKIIVEADKPLVFTMYKPSDPFRVVVELTDTRIGNVTDRILVDRDSIFEIVPIQVESPSRMARLEIGLTAPLDLIPMTEGNRLYLSVPKAASATDAPVAASASPAGGGVATTASVASAEAPKPSPAEHVPEAQPLDRYPVPDGYAAAFEPGRPASNVSAVKMEDLDDKLAVHIVMDGISEPKVYNVADKNRLIVDVPGVATSVTGNVEPVISPVKAIRAGLFNGNARIVIDFYAETEYDVATDSGGVTVEVKKRIFVPTAEMEARGKSAATAQTQEAGAGQAPPVEAAASASVEEASDKAVPKITLNFQNHDVVPIYRLLARVGGYNLVVHPEVKGTIPDLYLENVPWNQALDIVLKLSGHGKQMEGNILRIAPHEVFAREFEQIAQNKDAVVKAADLVELTIPINYAEATQVETAIKQSKLLSARGNITIDKRLNTIIMSDTQDSVDKVAQLVKKMDIPKSQVMIEARMVSVKTGISREIGVRWGTSYINDPPASTWGHPIPGDAPTVGVFDTNMASVAPTIFGMAFGTIADNFNLSIALAALETNNDGKVLSNPRVLTMDNEQAVMKQGTKIPYKTVSDEGTKTEFIDAFLSLEVTPRITPGGYVQLKVKSTRASIGVSTPDGLAIDADEVETNALVKDGETIVLGGIYTKDESEGADQIPFLGDIPVLGWLFKSKSTKDAVNELLIFITPRIVKEQRPM